jgi:deazaflavin-dependent oxidoreductase (nitroreductase family)
MVVVMWRLGLGRIFGLAPSTIGTVLVLHHVGRKSGRRYRSPVNFAQVDNELYCVAAFGEGADWYRNLMASPRTEVWLPTGRWMVHAEDISDDPQRIRLIREVLLASGFAAPAFGLFPRSMSDDQVQAATEDARLLHLRWEERIGDPVADLAWVWLLLALEWIAGRIWFKKRARRA